MGGQPFRNVLTAGSDPGIVERARMTLPRRWFGAARGRLEVYPGHRSCRSERTEAGPAARRPVSGLDGRERPPTVQPGVVSNVPVSVCDFVGRMGERATTL